MDCKAGTSTIHAETFARALGGSVVDEAASEWTLVVGVSPETSDWVRRTRHEGRKVAAYWIGSDSLCALQDPWYRKGIGEYDVHLAVHERIQKELSFWKVDSSVVYPCSRYTGGRQRIQRKAVGVYCPTPEAPQDLYRTKTCLEIAGECPAVEFIFYGSEAPTWATPENVKWWGRKDADDVGSIYDSISCVLRLCIHDGFPVGGIEAKQRGLHVIEDYAYPGFICPEVTVTTANGPRTGVSVDEIVNVLRGDWIHEGDKTFWPDWYQKHCSPEGFKEAVTKVVGEL